VEGSSRGVCVEGPHDGPARDLGNEFWQQAETLVGMLDAYLLLADCDGTTRWDYLGHAWKNNYHTTRSMVQILKRLRKVEERGLPC
jgi:mannobiose 2-epimerase